MSDMNSVNDVSDSEMTDRDLRLDGNAAAGLLAEIFAFEMTSAQGTCAHCGQTGPVGSLLRYGGEMGTILRCATCEQVQLRITSIRGQYWIDMRGMTSLRIAPANPT